MIDWYLSSRALIKEIRKKALDALKHCEEDEANIAKTISSYMATDYKTLYDHWLSMFPTENNFGGYLGRHIHFGMQQDFKDILNYDLPEIEEKLDAHLSNFKASIPTYQGDPYVAESRIEELSESSSQNFDTSKLIKLLRELNFAHATESYLTIGMLLRSILDHVPPIFSVRNFSEVASNYKGTKSFKASMQHINDSLRNLADSYLHVQIRKKESLPNFIQVDFRADLDALLAEIVRISEGV